MVEVEWHWLEGIISNEHLDPKHDPRGTESAISLQGHFSLTDEELDLLHQTCSFHTKEAIHKNITIQTCFDSDRLDLDRGGIIPVPQLLCTDHSQVKK